MPTLTNVIEIVARGTLAETSVTKNIDNVFHFRLNSGALDTRLAICNGFYSTIFTNAINNLLTSDYSLASFDCRLLDDATEQYTNQVRGTPGVLAPPRLPGDTAVTLPLRTSTRGRNFRGSKHLSAPQVTNVTKDELNGTGEPLYLAFAALLLAGFTTANGSTMRPVVVSRTLSSLSANPTKIVGADVVSVLVNKTIGTMRRRKEKTVR